MRIISASEIEAALDYRVLVERLRQAFRFGGGAPLRHRHTIPTYGEHDATLMLMPAWQTGRHIGVKIATLFPDNAARKLPTIMGAYLLLDGKTGSPLALIDGPALTNRRTACTSALGAQYLARQDCERLLMVGTGALAPHLILAHAAVRPICHVLIWGRTPAKADRLASRMDRPKFRVRATQDLEGAARGAHVICCATASETPLIHGDWLAPGTHLDLVGGHTPEAREADDAAVAMARVFVDSREGALAEAGDIIQPIQSGVLRRDDIAGDLFDLARGERAGRRYYDQITLFKSVGMALEDLAAAQLAAEVV
ncbi:MAG: ornithine cyclodeaminase family protein [Alphaproteobacteria bacterium]|jgi:ornithine cyclodeaminase|nr:ornithine cyclodeaminase family protein [Alphaproteobacteria bacterium]